MLTAESIFLIPGPTFVAELIVFLAILGLISKYLLPVITKSLEDRQEKIRTSLEAATKAQAAADEAATERARILDEAREQARVIVANAQSLSDQIKYESGARGQAEYDRIVANAQAEVAAAKQRAVEEADRKSTRLNSSHT